MDPPAQFSAELQISPSCSVHDCNTFGTEQQTEEVPTQRYPGRTFPNAQSIDNIQYFPLSSQSSLVGAP